jgi:FKBP-type peptidyl-prolyl cis-trans isomerase FkpA
MKNLKLLTWVMIIGFISACNGGDRGFSTADSGLKYKFHHKSGNEKAELDLILSMDMVYRLQDSIIFDSRESGMPMYLELSAPQYPGDIYEGLAMMAIGDSATFIIDAEAFFFQTVGVPELPYFIKSGDKIYFDVKLNNVMDEEGFMLEQERLAEEQIRINEQRALDEDGILDQYLLDENITMQPLPSGLYYIEKEKGDGPKVQEGQTVSVHYEGKLIDGTVFDSSFERGTPLDFVVGSGQVIPGWDEGISMMNVGGKATLVIPSRLGYGERGAGQVIPPYSTLIFEVELVDAQ